MEIPNAKDVVKQYKANKEERELKEIQVRQKLVDEQRKVIYKGIIESASKGFNTFVFVEFLMNELKNELKEKGYRIEIVGYPEFCIIWE